MLIKRPSDIVPSEITSQTLYEGRRKFIKQAGLASIAGAAAAAGLIQPRTAAAASATFTNLQASPFSISETQTPLKDVTSYNNYYEFGADKSDPVANAGQFITRPWSVTIEGLVQKPRTLSIDDILKIAPLEERIYRMRCVEGWSMVIPWVGFPLDKLLKAVEPLGSAKYVEFWTALDRPSMPGTKRPVLDWPYVEGLRLDEARHPLAIMAVGLYGMKLFNQNGAPLRLVAPWKYGFKGGKSIVKIRLVDKQPMTAWIKATPAEYGFYANVNPEVEHPRWSQARERRIGEFFKRPTLMFNGYADQVAQLYSGMDLRKNF